MIITFCGHAEFHRTKEHEKKILELLQKYVGDRSADIYLGGYGDFDSLAYDCCKRYKETHSQISLIFITPYITVEYQKNHLEYQKKMYDEIIYPPIESKAFRFAITYRNRWMIERSDYVICGITHEWGGAYKTYKYALQKNKSVINITDKNI